MAALATLGATGVLGWDHALGHMERVAVLRAINRYREKAQYLYDAPWSECMYVNSFVRCNGPLLVPLAEAYRRNDRMLEELTRRPIEAKVARLARIELAVETADGQ